MKKGEVTVKHFFSEHRELEAALKPCPFCGNAEIELAMIHPQYYGKPDMDYWLCWEIRCPECGAGYENGKLDSQTWDDALQEIIAAWNRREAE